MSTLQSVTNPNSDLRGNTRRLTIEEIDRITRDTIVNTYPDIDLYDYVIRNIRRNIKDQLEDVEISIINIEQNITDLVTSLTRAYILSKVPNGVYKGIQTSHVLGQFATQTTLHSKRGQQGAKSYVSAFDTIREYVKFKADLKENIIYTYLKDKIEYEKAFRMYVPMFTQVNLGQILTNYILYDLSRNDVESIDMSWYDTYFNMGGTIPPNDRIFIRMSLNKDMIYSMKITMEVLINNLTRSFKNLAVIVPSPSYLGIIDIYPVVDALQESKQFKNQVLKKLAPEDVDNFSNNLPKLFISGSIIPNLDNLQVSGIAGVEYVHPVRMSISSVIKGEKDIGEGMWEIIWDQVTASNTGILSEDVKNLFRTIGIDPIQYSNIPDRLFIIGWSYKYSPMSLIKALELIQGFTSYEEDTDETWTITYDPVIITNREDIDLVFRGLYETEVEHLSNSAGITDDRVKISGWNYRDNPQIELQRLASEFKNQDELVYLEVHSLNYVDIMSHDKVDARRTITNNLRNILNTLGIEALRNVMIVNIGRLLEQSGSEFNFRHIELLVDHFTMHGYATPVSTIGIEGQRLGPFSESSFQEGDRILLKAAQFGRTDNINTPSAYLTVGKRGAFGKDYNESLGTPISRDPEENAIYMRYRQDNSTTDYILDSPLEFPEYDIKMDELAVNMANPALFVQLFQETMKSNPVPPSERLDDITESLVLRNPVNTPSLYRNSRRLFIDQLRFLTKHRVNKVVYIGRSVRHLGLLASLFPDVTFLVFGAIDEVYTTDNYDITVIEAVLPEAPDSNIILYRQRISDQTINSIIDVVGQDSVIALITDIVRDTANDSALLQALAQQYKWAYELAPQAALLPIRIPTYDGPLRITPNAQRIFDELSTLGDGLALRLVEDYNNRIFRYYTGDIMLQPWSEKLSTVVSLYTDSQTVGDVAVDTGKLTYYNVLERPYRYHINEHASEELGFDHCGDCASEDKVWRDYLDTEVPVDTLVTTLSDVTGSLLSEQHGKFFSNPINPALILV